MPRLALQLQALREAWRTPIAAAFLLWGSPRFMHKKGLWV
ncbi:hypothetical protein APS_0777 [Acetobacter pasteurianus subsp. pasteurianus LMG 1262 = NBRC 106471]|nr:hypothetical protein APS_0777 [Acetobacter pasteurianus subsp. pasteurianus LMG 1262 = NBRC 106471]CCT60104.1 hypothetical protein APA386B_2051 [Acetobacter pasteurianus 386B]